MWRDWGSSTKGMCGKSLNIKVDCKRKSLPDVCWVMSHKSCLRMQNNATFLTTNRQLTDEILKTDSLTDWAGKRKKICIPSENSITTFEHVTWIGRRKYGGIFYFTNQSFSWYVEPRSDRNATTWLFTVISRDISRSYTTTTSSRVIQLALPSSMIDLGSASNNGLHNSLYRTVQYPSIVVGDGWTRGTCDVYLPRQDTARFRFCVHG